MRAVPVTSRALVFALQSEANACLRKLAERLGVEPAHLANACQEVGSVVVAPAVIEPLGRLVQHQDLAGGEVWPEGMDRDFDPWDCLNFTSRLQEVAVAALAAENIDMSTWVIVRPSAAWDSPPAYYVEGGSWVEDQLQASIIYGYRKLEFQVPVDCQWGRFFECHRADACEEPDADDGFRIVTLASACRPSSA